MKRRGFLSACLGVAGAALLPVRKLWSAPAKVAVKTTVPSEALYPHWRNYTFTYSPKPSREELIEKIKLAMNKMDWQPPIKAG